MAEKKRGQNNTSGTISTEQLLAYQGGFGYRCTFRPPYESKGNPATMQWQDRSILRLYSHALMLFVRQFLG